MDELWSAPTPRVCEIIRAVAEKLLPVDDELVERLWAASQSRTRQRDFVEDPVLAEADRKLNKAIMTQWLASNLRDPGRRVPPSKDAEMLIFARDLVLRGMDTDELQSWRATQQVAWSAWVEACFAATTDVSELRELLEICGNSLTTFIDDSISAVATTVADVREELGHGDHADRHTTVQLLLQGAHISRARAEAKLGYALTGHHVACVVWVDAFDDAHQLEPAAELMMRECGAAHRLSLITTSASQWVWIPADDVPPVTQLAEVLKRTPGVRVAFGRPGVDLAGFRSSHVNALSGQRLLTRTSSPRRVVRYEDVHLLDLLSSDPAQAEQFVTTTLGDLAHDEPVLRHTLLTYLDEGSSLAGAADRLFAHRNTIDRRLARARALLPRPLDENPTSVAAALMLLALSNDHQN